MTNLLVEYVSKSLNEEMITKHNLLKKIAQLFFCRRIDLYVSVVFFFFCERLSINLYRLVLTNRSV